MFCVQGYICILLMNKIMHITYGMKVNELLNSIHLTWLRQKYCAPFST